MTSRLIRLVLVGQGSLVTFSSPTSVKLTRLFWGVLHPSCFPGIFENPGRSSPSIACHFCTGFVSRACCPWRSSMGTDGCAGRPLLPWVQSPMHVEHPPSPPGLASAHPAWCAVLRTLPRSCLSQPQMHGPSAVSCLDLRPQGVGPCPGAWTPAAPSLPCSLLSPLLTPSQAAHGDSLVPLTFLQPELRL